MDTIVTPKTPYFFKGGRFPGKSLESLVFSRFGYVVSLYGHIAKNANGHKNELHEHLEWMMQCLASKIPTNLKCRVCGQPATYFLIPPYNYNIGTHLVCCNDEICKKRLSFEFNGQGRLHSFNLTAIAEDHSVVQKRQLIGLYKEALGLDLNRLSDEKIFNILKSINT